MFLERISKQQGKQGYRFSKDAMAAIENDDDGLQADVARILNRYDNRYDRLVELLTGMLGNRDQWLGHIVDLRSGDGFNRDIMEAGGELLIVSQFTLYGDVSRGRRPSFVDAAEPALAEKLYEEFVDVCRSGVVPVATGEFGARMEVSLVNEGPVTLVLER